MFFDLLAEMQSKEILNDVGDKALRTHLQNLWHRDAVRSKSGSLSKKDSLQLPLTRMRQLAVDEIGALCSKIANQQTRSAESAGQGEEGEQDVVKGNLLIAALINFPKFRSDYDTVSALFTPLYQLLIQWRSLPKLMEQVIASFAQTEPAQSLRILDDVCSSLVNGRSQSQNQCSGDHLRSDEFTLNFDWSNMMRQLLMEPHRATWSVVSK